MLYYTSETVKYSLGNNFSASYKVNLHRIRINLFYYLKYHVREI